MFASLRYFTVVFLFVRHIHQPRFAMAKPLKSAQLLFLSSPTASHPSFIARQATKINPTSG
jgi:hypothetical protein